MKNLTKGNPIKLIILFAVPLFIGQLFQSFYSVVDTRIIGSTLGDTALAAVGSTTPLSDVILFFVNGITNGFAIVIARYFGANEQKDLKKSIAGTVMFSIGITLILSVCSLLLLRPLLSLLHVSPELFSQARSYIAVILEGMIACTLYNMCAAILRAIGDSFTPLLFLIVSTFANIILDYLFILYFHMGVSGAAFATIVAQMISAVMCYLYMKKKYPQITLHKEDFECDRTILSQLLASGLSMGFMISFVSLGTLALQTTINTFGTNIIVAHTAARKLTSIFMLPFSVLGSTLATYCGQNYGAKEYGRIKQGIRDTLWIVFAWCILVIVITYTLAPVLIQLLTNTSEKEVIETASLYLRVDIVFYFVAAMISIFRNSMQGFGDTKTPILSSSLELLGKVLIAYILAPAIGYWGIIIAEPIIWFIMVIPLIINTVRNPIFHVKPV